MQYEKTEWNEMQKERMEAEAGAFIADNIGTGGLCGAGVLTRRNRS